MNECDTNPKSISPAGLPENYNEVLYRKLSQHAKLLFILNVVGLILMALASALFFAWANLWRPLSSGDVNIGRWPGIVASLRPSHFTS